jgi:hypothetical protein
LLAVRQFHKRDIGTCRLARVRVGGRRFLSGDAWIAATIDACTTANHGDTRNGRSLEFILSAMPHP